MSNPSPKSPLPPRVAAVINRLRSWFLSRSSPARTLIVTTAVLGVLFATYFGYSRTHEPYSVLYTQLEQDDMAAIVAKLKELKTPYRLDAGGSTVEVPESRVDETRLELASAGMPRGGGVGFESFDKMRLGATEFEQHVLYRRALEGELARTIGTLGAVQSARVHLVLPEKSLFVSRAEPASASIVLKLRAARTLGSAEVASVVHLTAASVPGLTPERVAVVTTSGEMLKRPRPAGGADGVPGDSDDERGSEQHALETHLEDRARAMLERVVGAGHVDVRVAADVDQARIERTEDHYDPARTALRSEQVSSDHAGGAYDDSVAGVPGAESNLPSGAAVAASATTAASPVAKGDAGAPKPAASVARTPAEATVRESHTRNYEVDHVSERRVVGPGTIRRIAVAVVLDGLPRTENGRTTIVPRDQTELDKLALLVRSAVGANDARGDVVTVDSVPFDEERNAVDSATPLAAPSVPRTWRSFIPVGAGVAGVFLLALGVAAVARRRRKPDVAAATELLPGPARAPELEASKANVDVRAAAIERAAADPATAALVLRAWLGTLDGESKTAPASKAG